MANKHGEHGIRAQAREHFILAFVVASAIVVLHFFHLIAWLDAGVMRWTGAFMSAPDQREPPKADDPGTRGDPAVVLIGQLMYEREFRQTSPLDRERLGELVRTMAEARPSKLVVDIDVSPNSPLGLEDEPLNRALLSAARSGTLLVLPVPGPVASADLVTVKTDWMSRMCAAPGADIEFAWPQIRTSGAEVLDFDASLPTLGVVARDRSRGLCESHIRKGQGLTLVDANVATELREQDIRGSGEEPRKFDAEFLKRMILTRQVLNASGDTPQLARRLAQRTVFLGGAFSAGDQFGMPVAPGNQRMEGALIHAAIYASFQPSQGWGPLRHLITKLWEFAFEVVLGVVCAFVFAWMFQRLELARNAWFKTGTFGSWFRTRLWTVLTVALLIALVLGAVAAKGGVLWPRFELWPDLGAVVLGIFIKFAIASRHELEHVAGAERKPAPLRSRLGQRIDKVLAGALVSAALGCLVWESGLPRSIWAAINQGAA